MQNSFEKQVQDKMNELGFNPSAPVWQNIEAQIRKKKERRRILLWLPLLLLLLAGGGWWLLSGKDTANRAPVTSVLPSATPGRTGTGASPSPATNDETAGGPHRPVNEDVQQPAELPGATTKGPVQQTQTGTSVIDKPTVRKGKNAPVSSKASRSANAYRSATGKSSSSTATIMGTVTGNVDHQPMNKRLGSEKSSGRKAVPGEGERTGPQFRSSLPAPEHEEVKPADTAAYRIAVVPSLFTGPVLTGKFADLAADRHWRHGLFAFAGASSRKDGMQIFSMNKSLDMAYAAPVGATPVPQDSSRVGSERYNTAFAIGYILRREVSPRLRIYTGMQYNYYSTKSGEGRVDSFTLTTGVTNGISRIEQYTNRFHFVSLPFGIEWKVMRTRALYLDAGFSVQQMLGGDAVFENNSSRTYRKDPEMLQRTQLFFNAGLSYAALRVGGVQVEAGPRIQWGLSKVEKAGGSNEHLFALGLQTRFILWK